MKRGNKDLIAAAFWQVQSQGPPEIGAIVGSYSDPLAYELIDIVGNIAICDLPDGTVKEFPIEELADVNEVKDLALQMKFTFSLQEAYHKMN